MNSSACEKEDDCVSLETLALQVQQIDFEHEVIISGMANRMTNMETKFEDFKESVKADLQQNKTDTKEQIQTIKTEIPELFKSAMNEMLAKIAKWMLLGVALIVLAVIVSFSKAIVLEGIKNIYSAVETYKVGE
jgi:hypothetical protein